MIFTRTTSPPMKAKGSFHLICTPGFILNCFFLRRAFVHLNRAKRRAINWLAIWHFLKEWNYNSFWQGKQWRWLQSIPETNPFSSTSPSRLLTCQCRYLGQSLQEDSWSYPQEPPAVHLNKYRKTHRVYQKYLQEHPQQIYRAATITVREERVCSNPWSLIVVIFAGESKMLVDASLHAKESMPIFHIWLTMINGLFSLN